MGAPPSACTRAPEERGPAARLALIVGGVAVVDAPNDAEEGEEGEVAVYAEDAVDAVEVGEEAPVNSEWVAVVVGREAAAARSWAADRPRSARRACTSVCS
jgi:hypothetical protein